MTCLWAMGPAGMLQDGPTPVGPTDRTGLRAGRLRSDYVRVSAA
jgi:hypothetical protein